MHQFFLICATIGGTILILRLGLSLLGFGFDSWDSDIGDIHATSADVDLGAGHNGHSQESAVGKIFTFQAIVSFLAFFGIGGLSALEAKLAPALAVLIGTAVGFASVMLLGYALRALRHLNADGTVRLERAVGLIGTVYIRVPSGDSGEGKIILPIQGRTVEVVARTPGPELRAGEAVIVSRSLDDRTVEIVAAHAYVNKPSDLAD